MGDQIKFEQEKYVFNEHDAFYILQLIFFYCQASVCAYALLTNAIRSGILGYLACLCLLVFVFALLVWLSANLCLAHCENGDRGLRKFLSRLCDNKYTDLVRLKYCQGFYTFWFQNRSSWLLTRPAAIMTIQDSKLTQMIKMIDEKGTIEFNDDQKLESMAAKIIEHRLSVNEGIDFKVALRKAKYDCYDKAISYEEIHPLLLRYAARKLSSAQ